jgi:uncharacterized protein YjbI with pentapeptide repeats
MDKRVPNQVELEAGSDMSPVSSDIRELSASPASFPSASGEAEAGLDAEEAAVLLRGGAVGYWNRWRQVARPPSLAGCDLRGADLTGVDFSHCDLRRANLAGAKLTRADLSDADLAGSDLTGAQAEHACFARARLVSANLATIVADYAKFDDAVLVDARFASAKLTGAKFVGVRAIGSRFEDAKLVNADFARASLDWADFIRADFRSANLEGVRLDATSFSLANMAGTRFDRGRFDGVLGLVETTSTGARAATLGMLGACAYSLLSSMSVRRAVLLSDAGSFKLPLLQIDVSARVFFVFAPFACLFGFAYLHFYAHHGLRLMLKLPARFADGLTLSERTYPWPFNMLLDGRLGGDALGHEAILMRREEGLRAVHLMSDLGRLATTFVNWILVPLTIAALAIRVVAMQRWAETVIATLTFWACVALSVGLRHRERVVIASYARGEPRPRVRPVVVALLILGAALSLVLALPPVMVRLSVPNLENEDLKGANLQSALLRGANMRRAHLDGARLDSANFNYARLYSAILSSTYAPNASFYCSILENAKLDGAVANQADFRRAVLRGADLTRARLQGARLEGADLRGARLEEVEWDGVSCDRQTRWPGDAAPGGVHCDAPSVSAPQTCMAEAESWSSR